ncbi:hypothetical protein [Microbispora sp. GKU 823]|uniref:hypothetical protein n=1 Tax=Microbispora sp. GKU 823 TaxID=1652100 RepID=UPI0015C43975|nr:hypothetical protein [Microbispora sp. GKU 823]
MRMSADDRLAEELVRITRRRCQERLWGFEEPSGLPQEERAADVEQPAEQEA